MSSAEEKEDMNKQRLNIYRKKQWQTFKVQDKAQKKSVIGAHNRSWKYLLCAITKHGESKRNLEFIGEDKDRQLESLWKETNIGDVLPWEDITDEAERLIAISKGGRNAAKEGHADKELENDQEVERDEIVPYTGVIFGRRRPWFCRD